MDLKSYVRDVPDFPKKGIIFKDITPLLGDPEAFGHAMKTLADRYRRERPDAVVAIESRGFILGGALAAALGVPFVPMRKPGKLPFKTIRESYQLEYGTDQLEIHVDSLKPGASVVILDDVLATGGTAAAAANLVQKAGGQVRELAFLIDLTFLKGREKLKSFPVYSILQY